LKIAIIGTGNVGLVTGACFASKGHEVVCVDLDPERVSAINEARAPFYEVGLQALLEETVPDQLSATVDLETAVQGADVSIIAVGTPNTGSGIDLSQVETAALQIGKALRGRVDYQLVIVKSSVLPGVTDGRILPILENSSGRRAGEDLGVAMNPEFLREGQAVEDFLEPDRIVMGGSEERTWEIQERLFDGFGTPEIVRTTNATAETIKFASNALLATMISYSNEVGNVCSTVDGVDVTDVLRGVHLDKRLSPVLENGERVEPGFLSYLLAGCGFGGSCLPKDVRSFVDFGRERGVPMEMLRATLSVNAGQPERLVERIERRLGSLDGLSIAILGLSFKPGTSDIRETPSIPVARDLLGRGARLRVFDPVAQEAARAELGESGVYYSTGLSDAIDGVDAIVLMTSWPEFRELPRLLEEKRVTPLVFDGRRMLDRKSVAHYDGIGLGPQDERLDQLPDSTIDHEPIRKRV